MSEVAYSSRDRRGDGGGGGAGGSGGETGRGEEWWDWCRREKRDPPREVPSALPGTIVSRRSQLS